MLFAVALEIVVRLAPGAFFEDVVFRYFALEVHHVLRRKSRVRRPDVICGGGL